MSQPLGGGQRGWYKIPTFQKLIIGGSPKKDAAKKVAIRGRWNEKLEVQRVQSEDCVHPYFVFIHPELSVQVVKWGRHGADRCKWVTALSASATMPPLLDSSSHLPPRAT